MIDTLVIVESPAKAKTIGKYLGSKYKVIASNGHVRDLPKSQLGVDIENGFKPKYITLRGRGEVLEKIRKEAKQAKHILLATDPDREGEAISWHLAHVLKLDPNSECRVVFNEITKSVLKSSIKNPRAINGNLVDAQQARRVLDRLVGYKISPLLWAKVRKGLSAGRVQSVATRIICDREREIMEFIPEEYWSIIAKLRSSHSRRTFSAKFYGYNGEKVDVRCEQDAKAITMRSAEGQFIVTDIKKADKVRHASPPFTTSSMLQEASRKIGMTPKITMSVAQQLYEGMEIAGYGSTSLISYIRTDSVRVSAEAQSAALDYIKAEYGELYVPARPNVYRGRNNAQDAHEAIRPTNLLLSPEMLRDKISSSQYKLYKLIYDRFIASQMSDARYIATAAEIDSNGCSYRATGIKTVFDGFTRVYMEGKDETEDKETELPELNVGEVLQLIELKPEQHFTQPPARYTEASLVRALEEKGIGRPSTYSPTISTIIDRGYVRREKKHLIPTDLGFIVTQLMKDNFSDIVDVSFTADMERRLDDVENGSTQWSTVIADFYQPFEQSVEAAFKNVEKIKLEDEVSNVICDKCGAMMVYKVGKYGRFLACPRYPECTNTKRILEFINVKCPLCGAELVKCHSRKGRAFYGCERHPECSFMSWDKPLNEKCPKCGKFMVQKVGKFGSYKACSDKECGYVFRPTSKRSEKEKSIE